MSVISLVKGSIRISLTAAEARSCGFHALHAHYLMRQTDADGGMTLVYSSEPLPPGPRGTSAAVWIPPVQTSRVWDVSPGPSTTRPDAKPVS